MLNKTQWYNSWFCGTPLVYVYSTNRIFQNDLVPTFCLCKHFISEDYIIRDNLELKKSKGE